MRDQPSVEHLSAQNPPKKIVLTILDAFTTIAKIPLEKTARALRLLDQRAFDLRTQIREQLLNVWYALVHIEEENGLSTVKIHDKLSDEPTTLNDAVIGFKSFKSLDAVAKKLWETLDSTIFRRRMNIGAASLPSLAIDQVCHNAIESRLSCAKTSRIPCRWARVQPIEP